MNFEKKSINEIKKPMNDDFLDVQNAEGMPALVDSSIALEFLLTVKTGIRNFAIALTEIADEETRNDIRTFLSDMIDLHAELTELMLTKGWLHPYDVDEQFKVDNISAETAIKIANLDLFPGDTSRLGTFSTPNY